MADKKISQLNTASAVYDTDDFALVQDAETKQVNASTVKAYVKDGLSKSDVGLGNVDNTSDATKNSATATLTNKTLTSPTINGGTVNNVAIGGTTPAAGNFTTLSATGNTTLGDASGDTLTINAGTTTFTQGTANGVLYLNGSKVATSGSALTFDGANLRVNGVYAVNQTNLVEISNGQSGDTKYATGISLISNSGGIYASGLYAVSGSDTRWNLITGSPTTVAFYSSNIETARITSKGLLVGYTSDSSLSGTGNAIFSGNVGIGGFYKTVSTSNKPNLPNGSTYRLFSFVNGGEARNIEIIVTSYLGSAKLRYSGYSETGQQPFTVIYGTISNLSYFITDVTNRTSAEIRVQVTGATPAYTHCVTVCAYDGSSQFVDLGQVAV